MNGLYNLRYRPTNEEYIYPKVQKELTPDNTVNTLLDILTKAQSSQTNIEQNALLKSRPIESTAYQPNIAERSQLQIPSTEIAPILPEPSPTNALSKAHAPTTQKPVNSLLDYWKQPIIGKMPLDQFIQIAGALSSAIAPQEPMGRAGAALSQIGGVAYTERVKREQEELESQRKEPENVLRRRLLEAQIKKFEGVELPEITSNIVRDPTSETGFSYVNKRGNIIAKNAPSPEKPKIPTPRTIPTIQDGMFGEFEIITKIFTPIRKATPKDIEDIETGKIKEPKTYEPHSYIKPDGTIGWVEPGKEVPKGWKPYEKAGIDKEITPIQYWGVVSKIEDDARSYANVTVPKAASGISFPPGGGIVMGGGIAKEDVDKWINAYKSHYARKVDEAKRMKALPEDYSTEPPLSTKVTPEAEIEGGAISSRGKIVPPPQPVPAPPKKENTIQNVIGAGGKAVKMPDGSTHVFDKDGNYVGTAK